MKIKYAWIPFVLTILAAVPFRVYQLLYLVDLKTGFSKEGDISDTVFLGVIAAALLLICIMCLCDRTAPYKNVPHRNILAGIFGILLSLAMFYVSASELMNYGASGVKAILSGVFCALAAVSMLAMSVGMTYGKNVYENMPLLALLIPIWGCVRLVITFMNYTSIANISQHLFNMLAIIFLLLFQYSQAKMLAGVGGQKIIRSLFLFGFPAVVFAVLASVPWFVLYFSGVQAGVYEETPLTLGYSALDCLFALFILCFLIGVYAKTVKSGLPGDKKPHPVKQQEAEKAESPAAINFDGMNEDLQKEFFLFGEKKPEEETDDDSNEPLYFNSLVAKDEPQAAKETVQAPAEKPEEKSEEKLEEPPASQEAEIKPQEAEALSEPAAEQPIQEAVLQEEPEDITPAPESTSAGAQQANPQGTAPAFAYPAPPYPYAAYPYPPAYPYGYPPAQPPYPAASTPEEYAAYLQTIYQTPEQFTNRAPSPYPPDAPYLKNRQQPGAPHPAYPYYPYPPYPYMPMYQPYWPAPEQPMPPHNDAEQK